MLVESVPPLLYNVHQHATQKSSNFMHIHAPVSLSGYIASPFSMPLTSLSFAAHSSASSLSPYDKRYDDRLF
jgi:hypothetical protein